MSNARRPIAFAPSAPIKGYSWRGFVIGWLAIVVVLASGFFVAAEQLGYDNGTLRVAHAPISSLAPGRM